MSCLKSFKVQIKRKDPEEWIHIYFKCASTAQGAVTSWVKAPPKKLRYDTVARAISVDINMSPHCQGFEESPTVQKKMIIDFLKRTWKFLSQVDIYGENKSFTKDLNGVYTPTGHAKLHWHGIIRFHDEYFKDSTVEKFIKDMRKRFSCSSASTTYRAVFYKKIRNGDHLRDRTQYQTKQQPKVESINLKNNILEKNI